MKKRDILHTYYKCVVCLDLEVAIIIALHVLGVCRIINVVYNASTFNMPTSYQ